MEQYAAHPHPQGQGASQVGRPGIHHQEEQRASYYDYYTGKKWGHSESYDLCINSSHLGIEETEKFIAEFIRKKFGLSD